MSPSRLPDPRSDRALLLSVTLVVAVCSIAYELVYSELLRILLGGTVVRYSITIGLFLFSLGIGAVLSNYVAEVRENFFRVEVWLAVAGPAGLVGMILLHSLPAALVPLQPTLTLVASHAPIVIVGVLSGLEIPFLSEMIESERSAFSEVLGVDYFGSLVGTVVYALVLFPRLGVVNSVFVLGLLNAVAALVFAVRFSPGSRALLLACLLVTGLYGGVLASGDAVEDELTEAYAESQIEREYAPGTADAEVTHRFTTRYQEVVRYERGLRDRPGTDTCLRLDGALQLCDSWVDSYHRGLVDVPMAAVENGSETRVLLVGGGDWIAVDHLREYGVTVDHVDVDREFMEHTRTEPFYRQYHDDAHEYDRLNTTVADAYEYLRESDRRYDLVVLDLPGARSDDLLPLYSTEFYAQVRSHLTEDGFVATWSYSRYAFPEHRKAYLRTVREAGFDRYAGYTAYDDLDRDGSRERAEGFYLLSAGSGPDLNESRERARAPDGTGTLAWRPVPRYRGVEPNSVFDPNYDVLVEF